MSKNQLYKISALIALFVSPFSLAFAGAPAGRMNYSVLDATAVPTLSGTMLLVLSLLLFAVAVRVAKQKNNGTSKLFITLLGVSALSMGGGGLKLVSEAEAVAYTVSLPLPITTGTNSGYVNLSPGSNLFDNNDPSTNGQTVVIGLITESDGYSCEGENVGGPPRCVQGLQVPQNGQCQVNCSQPSN